MRLPFSYRGLPYFLLSLLVFVSLKTAAHEMRPALLDIVEKHPGQFEIKWKIPRVDNKVIRLRPVFPDWFEIMQESGPFEAGNGALYLYQAKAGRDVHAMTIRVEGIEQSLVDVWVQVQLLDGTHHSLLIQPNAPAVQLPMKETFWQTAKSYLELGMQHIWMGVDHLLFVLALLLMVNSRSKLFWTISAFTLAHSITLSLAALQVITLPGPPVEATIALSIVFLAWEYWQKEEGKTVFTAQYPWAVAFLFGLLHGLGFAGALQEIGLPQTQVPAALGFFNLGVEVGQILFVVTALGLGYFLKRIFPNIQSQAKWLAYGMGAMASFWLIDRVIGFWN